MNNVYLLKLTLKSINNFLKDIFLSCSEHGLTKRFFSSKTNFGFTYVTFSEVTS